MRLKTLLAVLLGVALGAGVGPLADYRANSMRYGQDHNVVIDPMLCLKVGIEVIPEIRHAKQMGVQKSSYMRYVTKDVDFAKLSREQVMRMEQLLFYFDQMWESNDEGVGAVDQCFERAEAAQKKPLTRGYRLL